MAFLGPASGFESVLLRSFPVAYYSIPSGALRRYFSLRGLLDAFRVLLGFFRSYVLLGRIRPRVVFSQGGFVSFPVVFAARFRGIPILLPDSDVTPGLADPLSMPFAD
jgi:UDP-N-acetylglucosamine:LPS N-acetylglucosamine transferase